MPGEIGEMLLAGGEHDPVDLGIGPLPDQRDFLVDLGEPGAQAAHGPLDRGVRSDQGPLPAEVPGRGVPVLDVDELELRPLAHEQLDRPGMERGDFPSGHAGGLADERGLGAFLEDDKQVVEVHAPGVRQADEAEQRGLDLDAPRHVEQRAARPECRTWRAREGIGVERRRRRSGSSVRGSRDDPSPPMPDQRGSPRRVSRGRPPGWARR